MMFQMFSRNSEVQRVRNILISCSYKEDEDKGQRQTRLALESAVFHLMRYFVGGRLGEGLEKVRQRI